jgi:YbbR domain-containing protein
MQFLQWLAGDIPLKATALVLAVGVWAYAVLDRSYSVSLTVPVELGKSEAKELLSDVDTKQATVTLTGRGKDLVSVRPKELRFVLERSEAKLGRKQVKLTAAELGLPANITMDAVDPEYVQLSINPASARTVVVQVPVSGSVPNGMAATVNRPPASVRLLGPEEEVKLIGSVSTETLDLSGLTQSGTVRKKVVPPAGSFATDPESVDISVTLDKEAARIFLGVPVKAIAPTGREVDIDPVEAQIAVAGPVATIDSLRVEQITAQIKISGLGPGDYRLAAEIVLPPEFHLVKCEPQLFDVTVK